MTTEFNLSEKIEDACWVISGKVIREKDIKEFIRLLKETSNSAYLDSEIDKLAGDKLIK